MLEDTLNLAEDSVDFNHFDGRLKSLMEDSDDLKLLQNIEEYFNKEDPFKLEEHFYKLKHDLEVMKVIDKLGEFKDTQEYTIEFDNVSFRYSPDSDFIFKNINCVFKAGITHGIVSASGLGKTTFLNLAIGLLKPTEGRVLVNGQDINCASFDHAKMMSHTAYITQSTQMFMESILVNLVLGNLPLLHRILLLEKQGAITKEAGIKAAAYKILHSLQQAQALQFVMAQEKGILTLIGDRGIGLSGGQLQRLALARTLFRDPQLVLMDEATSALDKLSEKRVIGHLETFLNGKTCFVITHNQAEYSKIVQEKHELAEIISKSKIQEN